MPMRTFSPSSFGHFLYLIFFRVNDLTVPYVTAAIMTSDPFAESETNGIELYVPISGR